MRKFTESPIRGVLPACIYRIFFVVSVILSTVKGDCRIGELNLNILNGYVWDARGPNATYQLSPCNIELHLYPSKSFVAIKDNGETSALGLSSNPVAFTENPLKHETQVTYTGEACGKETSKAIVYYKCGLSLGSPEFLDQYSCTTYFEWVTSAACSKQEADTSETKCYLHDTQGKKYDLSPLIKQNGAHAVQTKNGERFLINICRDITPDDASTGCDGSSACVVTSEGAVVKLGVPSQDNPLQKTTDDKLYLQYISAEKPPHCTDNPKTDITFICKRREGFTENKPPILMLSNAAACQYSIEWETEYACTEDYISVTGAQCGFSLESRDINLDLSSLNVAGGVSVVGANVDGSKNYTYYLNVCGDLGQIVCGKSLAGARPSACQEDARTGSTYILGMANKQRIRYADGSLQLIYTGGEYCHGSELHRSTIINFHCDQGAGVGSPVFSGKDGCDDGAYIFDWTTSVACLDTGASTTLCEVTQGGSSFDLSPLNTGGNVEVLVDDGQGGAVFLSICGDIMQEGSTSGCPNGAGVCFIDSSGTAVNYGKFSQSPQYSDGKLQLVYNNGDECGKGQHRSTSVLFKCSPGVMDSSPRLTHRTEDSCEFFIEWDTAAACELMEVSGSECTIHDPIAGLNFDLTMLKSAYYLIHNNVTGHDYYINVCDAVDGTPCDFETAVCQVDTLSKKKHDCGQPNSNLTYYNGIINITYSNGELYHDPAVPRKTQIAFLCNEDSGIGQPEFISETDHTYSFRWSTSYACPLRSVPCAVVNGTKQYDLSRLTKTAGQGNWYATEQANIPKTYYINVCGPVNPVDSMDCEPFAAMCGTQHVAAKEEMRFPNLGRAVAGRIVISDTHLLLNYTDGSECTMADGSKSKYNSELHLYCNPGVSEDSGPEFETRINNCTFSLRWDTPLACPLQVEEGNSSWPCTLKDPLSGHLINLNPLSRKADIYTVQGPKGSSNFTLNICGAIPTCSPAYSANQAAACHDGQSIGDLNTNIERSPEGMVTMTYRGKNEDHIKTVIEFPCNASIPLGEPKFNRQDDSTYYFLFETSLTCEPQPLECHAFDSAGGEYDLTPLKHNWLVLDTRPEHSDLKYYVSVCGPLTPIDGVQCPGGAVAGCQVNSDGTAYSLGYSQSEPLAAAPNTLTLHYRGGDICHKGKANENFRSVRLILECSSVEHDPVFLDETSECEYVINWKTVSACALRTNLGSNCIVEDPLLHHSFDLSALTNAGTADYQVSSGSDEFYINVCGDIRQQNDACGTGVGACLKSAGTSIPIGNANQNLSYYDGTLRLEYVDPKTDCGGDQHRTTSLTFKCDHKKAGHEGPVLSAVDDDRCFFYFDWWTSLACLPFQLQECSIRDSKGRSYDLSTLTRTRSNYRITSDTDSTMYVINVCTTLVHESDALCPPNTAACNVNKQATDPADRYSSIGELGSHMLQTINDRPVLTYENGHECSDGKKSRSIITLSCAPGLYETRPTFEFVEDSDCDYHFNWDTPAACALSETSDDDCTVQSPITGNVFDLSSYKSESGYSVQDGQGHSIMFNVCGQLKDSPCGPNTASCQVETANPSNKWSAGTPNSKLTFNDGVVTLQYTGGQICSNNQSRTTIIAFECGSEVEGQGQPLSVDETEHCTYLISWPTPDLCEEQVSCSVLNKDGKLVDLSTLNAAHSHHMAASSDGWAYYINICGEIGDVSGCSAQSTSCRRQVGAAAEDLGQFKSAPQLDEATGEIFLLMEGGKLCKGDEQWKTRILFSCLEGSDMGVATLESVDASKCEYIFSWKTNVVCAENNTPVAGKDCRYVDPITNAVYDFSKLHDKTYEVSGERGTYHVTACGAIPNPPSGCENSAVCFSLVEDPNRGMAFGSATNPRFISESGTKKLIYNEGAACNGSKPGKTSAYFLFRCDTDGSMGPELYSADTPGSCDVVFKWLTPLACPPVVKECMTTDSHGHLHDLRPLSFSNGSLSFTQETDRYWMNLCRGVSNGPEGCHHNAIVCRQSGGKVHSLGVVNSQKMTWDDSRSAVVLEYSQGDVSTCSSSTPSSVTISLLCGSGIGQPILTHKDESSCHFSFDWKTSLACYQERVSVFENNWKVHDPQTNGYFDLNLLDLKKTYRVKGDDFSYILHLHNADSAFPCPAGTAICQVTPTEPGRSTTIAMSSTRKFFFMDETLQLEYDSQSPCNPASSSGGRAKSIVNFHCVEGSTDLGEPSFVDRSEDCVYTFDWYTPVTCMSYSSRGVDGTSSSSPNSKTVAVIISVFLGMILVAILAVVFHKAERRKRFVNRIRVAFARRSSQSFRYSQLNALDENEDENTLLGGAVENNTEYGLNRHGNVQDFHDDSDEDMLL